MPKHSIRSGTRHRNQQYSATKRAKKPSNTSSVSNSRLLGLPAELRNEIWEYALLDLLNEPSRPYLPAKSRLRTYHSLLLVSKQVAHESKPISDDNIAPSLTVSCKSAPDMSDLLKKSSTDASLRKVRFHLCVLYRYPGVDDEVDAQMHGMDSFIALQHSEVRQKQTSFRLYDYISPRSTWSFSRYDQLATSRPRSVEMNTHYGVKRLPDIAPGLEFKKYLAYTDGNKDAKDVYWVIEGNLRDLIMDKELHIEMMRYRELY